MPNGYEDLQCDIGGHCKDHINLILAMNTLASKANYVLAALSVNGALLLCIFATLLNNGASYAAMSANVVTMRSDVDALQTLTRNHTAIEATQSQVLRRLELLEKNGGVH
jgi:hypothetical protein